MFESDDFDQVLSQFELPVDLASKAVTNENICDNGQAIKETEDSFKPPVSAIKKLYSDKNAPDIPEDLSNDISLSDDQIPNQNKRKLLRSLFDQKSKRKFPGPAGLLTGKLEETHDETMCQIELLSQDIDYSLKHTQKYLYESPLWFRLQEDLKQWDLGELNPIKTVKQLAVTGNLRRMKAQVVAAFIDTIDRSAIDPLIILRDITSTIKCTLHRDAWTVFSPYIVSEYCAIVLVKPTVLTTGSAFKKHYLNITLSNIKAVYSSTVKEDTDMSLPDGYVKQCQDEFTIIISNNTQSKDMDTTNSNHSTNGIDIMDDLDNIFSDDIF